MKDLTKREGYDITDGAIAGILFIALQFIFILLISLIPKHIRLNTFMYSFLSVLLEALFVVAVIIVSYFKQTDVVKANNLNKKVNVKIISSALGISLVCLWLFTNLTSGFMSILEKFGYSSGSSGTDISTFGSWCLSIVTICIVPAFCEELLFRGVILNSFRGFNKWIGISVSSIGFMLMHGNPDQTVHQLILGFVLGYIAWETRNIWITILVHFFNNFIAITITWVLSGGASNGEIIYEVPSWGQIALTLFLGVIYAIVGVLIIVSVTKSLKKESDKINSTTQNGEEQKLASASVVVNTSTTGEVETTQNISVNLDVFNPNYKTEQDGKPSRNKIVLAVCCYALFAAYFVYEWVGVLLTGLGL